jgi:hypothetical protein
VGKGGVRGGKGTEEREADGMEKGQQEGRERRQEDKGRAVTLFECVRGKFGINIKEPAGHGSFGKPVVLVVNMERRDGNNIFVKFHFSEWRIKLWDKISHAEKNKPLRLPCLKKNHSRGIQQWRDPRTSNL